MFELIRVFASVRMARRKASSLDEEHPEGHAYDGKEQQRNSQKDYFYHRAVEKFVFAVQR